MRAIKAKLSKFSTVEEYVHGWGPYYYTGGILLPTRKPEPEGSAVSIHIQIATGETVLRGEGLVQEVRTNSQGDTVGMVIRFTRLDARSKELVNEILSHKREVRSTANEAAVTGPPEPAVEVDPPAAPELGAIAAALDETFDSIFTGAFAQVTPDSAEGFFGRGDPAAAPSEKPPAAEEHPLASSPGGLGDGLVAADSTEQPSFASTGDVVAPSSADSATDDEVPANSAVADEAPALGRDSGAPAADREASAPKPTAGSATPQAAFATGAQKAAGRSPTVDAVNEVLGRIGIARGPNEPPHPDALTSRPIRPVSAPPLPASAGPAATPGTERGWGPVVDPEISAASGHAAGPAFSLDRKPDGVDGILGGGEASAAGLAPADADPIAEAKPEAESVSLSAAWEAAAAMPTHQPAREPAVALTAPPTPPQGLVARFLAWLRRLFGGT